MAGVYAPKPFGPPLVKPSRGSYQIEARERTAERKNHERREMDKARRRDNGCRWPQWDCHCRARKLTVDVAHADEHRKMGGNPSGERTKAELLISLCRPIHGAFDRGELDIVPTTPAKFSGPVDFYKRDERGRLYVFASERSLGVSVERTVR